MKLTDLRISLLHFCIVTLILSAAGQAMSADKAKVFVSIAPHSYFVKAIGGDLVEVEVLVPSGQSPATYEPTPGQLARLAEADVLFTTGVPFEKRLLKKISEGFDNLRIVAMHADIKLRAIERHDGGDHDHEGVGDPHVWLDPTLAARQADVIAGTLSEFNPSHGTFFAANLGELHRQIDSIHAVISTMLTPLHGKTMYVFHPAFGYFADAYGLKQEAIEKHGKEPSARQLAALIDEADHEGARVLFVQPQFSKRQAEAVGESIGAKIVTLDPLSEDYINNLYDMASAVAHAFEGSY